MRDNEKTRPINIALIGAGLFAREQHIPALKKLAHQFTVVAVYTRSETTASKVRDTLGSDVDIYTHLQPILQRDDIEAVDIVLPIHVIPNVVELALAAGKHVISEKPLAPDTAIAQSLIDCKRQHPTQVWMLAENWRFAPSILKAKSTIKSGVLGNPLLANWALHVDMSEQCEYFHTDWRKDGSFPGGYILDAGIRLTRSTRFQHSKTLPAF